MRDNEGSSILEGGKHLKKGKEVNFFMLAAEKLLPIKIFNIFVKGMRTDNTLEDRN